MRKRLRFINLSVKCLGILACLALGATASISLLSSAKASALSGSDFSAGHIIDDAIFTNGSAMSVSDIQTFLNTQLPSCDTNGDQPRSYYYNSSTGRINDSSDTWVTTSRAVYGQRYDTWNNTTIAAAPYVCLKSYVENPSNGQNNLQNPTASISGGQSAAQIIYTAAQTYGINPQVILTTLQKEQGLITDNWPWTSEYTEAMGYNCPDNGGCSGFSGFYQQVNAAAKQFRNYLNNPNDFNYVIGSNQVAYSPSCGGPAINIQNQATAALYDYTPYQPDNNVLSSTNPTGSSSGPGGSVSGDNCAAYGNRNFWWYFNTWFGSSLAYNVWYNWHDLAVDSTGDTMQVPVVLTRQPSSPVQVIFNVSDTSRAQIIANQSLFYNSSNWNSPSGHSITIKGLSPSVSSSGLYLQVSQIISDDTRYSQQSLVYYSKQPIYWMLNSERTIYRLYNSTTNLHAYTTSTTQETNFLNNGYALEGAPFYQCNASTETPLMVSQNGSIVGSASDVTLNEIFTTGQTQLFPEFLISNTLGKIGVHLLRNPTNSNDTLLTTSDAEAASAKQNNGFQEVAYFYGCEANSLPVYRLFNPLSGDHFYTTNSAERDFALQNSYVNEGSAFYLRNALSTPVFRLLNQQTKDHFYTIVPSERDASEQQGYQYEGIGYSIGGANTNNVYRLYNPSIAKHFYTTSTTERDSALQNGYRDEGIAFTTP